MRVFVLTLSPIWTLLPANIRLPAQNIDSIVTSASRAPISIADQIQNPAERAAFVALLNKQDPQKLLTLARSFLDTYPQSAFLAPVAEKGARASFDLGALQSGLDYARFSLLLLPENPLLLVAVADVQAELQQNEPAIASARAALDYLDRFERPAAIPEREWPTLKKKQQATAWFVIGRALVNESIKASTAGARQSLLEQATAALSKAHDLNPADMEFVYLLGLAYRYNDDWPHAVLELSSVSRHGKEFAAQAQAQLQAIFNAAKPAPGKSLDDFVNDLERQASTPTKPPAIEASSSTGKLGGYAGSASCARCHASIQLQWAQSGMARMLRPYRAENIFGDFEKNNQFYVGDDIVYRNGKLEISPGPQRALFARMVVHKGRHFFEIRQPDGGWHSYPVDYTIGSKWQQAYATRLPNGQIHVFPIQYNRIEKKWLNYWKVIDAPGSERANPLNWEKLDDSTNYLINCAVCHTSQLRNVHGGGYDPDNLVFREAGVDCEMCHGPSAQHVEAMTAGRPYQKLPAQPPVSFEKISNREFVAICSQCHMQSNVHAAGAQGELNYSTTGTFFLKNASLPLSEFTREAFFRDGRFRQTTFMVEALERSECFQKGQASCGSCHNPHVHNESSNPTSLKFQDRPDLMCTGCHSQFRDAAQTTAHTHHPLNSEGSRCVSCHMPRIMDALLFRARSHQIDDIPNAEMTLRFGQQDSPNACLLCHEMKSAQWVQEQMRGWKEVSLRGAR